MTGLRRTLALLTAVALAGGLTASLPARADHNETDDHSKNLRHLAQRRIKLGKRTFAEGSDLAFRGNLLVAGTYQGTAFFRILPRRKGYLRQISFHHCPGAQGDVSIYGDLVFVSIDSASSNSGRSPACNNTPTNRSGTSEGKEGIRIVDISRLRSPRQVGFVETDCGSHTHTLVPHHGELYIYVDSYPLSGQGPNCNHATHRKFSVIKVNLDKPAKSDVVSTPGLPPDTIGCHDTTVVPGRHLAVAACLGVWLTLDISNPVEPRILAEVRNPQIELDHSAAVTWDGRIAVVGDEHAGAAGGGGCSNDPQSPVGAMWFYDISDPSAPEELAHHSLPRVPTVDSAEEAERFRCTTHNFNIIPMRDPDRYVVVSAYYSGGIAAIDFSDPTNPREIAHYLRALRGTNPDTWSAYWYNGRIYTNDYLSHFGVGVYRLKGTGRRAARFFRGEMNPQTQIARFRR